MKNIKTIAAVLAFGLFATMSFGQIKVVAPNGDVGVGTSTPTEKLDVDGGIKVGNTTNTNAGTIRYNGSDLQGYVGGSWSSLTSAGGGGGVWTESGGEASYAGIAASEGFTSERTSASATALFNRTDGAAMLIGGGSQAGFVFDENFNFQIRSRSRNFVLARALSGGQYLLNGNGTTGHISFGFSTVSSTHRLRVNGSITGTGFTLPSDKKLKNNVNEFGPGLKEVMKLNPITYQYNGKAGISTDALQVGLFAQDLQEVAPELVTKEDHYIMDESTNTKVLEDSYLQINDTGIKYMLINAIKDQQAMILEQKEMIEAQAERIEKLEKSITTVNDAGVTEDISINSTSITGYDVAALAQNVPNPFNGETTINYVVPTKATNSLINIYNMDGKLLKKVAIGHTGKGELRISTEDIPNGTYSYELVVDGRSIDVKKMVVAN